MKIGTEFHTNRVITSIEFKNKVNKESFYHHFYSTGLANIYIPGPGVTARIEYSHTKTDTVIRAYSISVAGINKTSTQYILVSTPCMEYIAEVDIAYGRDIIKIFEETNLSFFLTALKGFDPNVNEIDY